VIQGAGGTGGISFFDRGEKPKLIVEHFQIGRMERAPGSRVCDRSDVKRASAL
jgi:hypothetical protein